MWKPGRSVQLPNLLPLCLGMGLMVLGCGTDNPLAGTTHSTDEPADSAPLLSLSSSGEGHSGDSGELVEMHQGDMVGMEHDGAGTMAGMEHGTTGAPLLSLSGEDHSGDMGDMAEMHGGNMAEMHEGGMAGMEQGGTETMVDQEDTEN